jgi:alpha-N-acetylglucosamine transferase
LDADIWIQRNLDHLFLLPSAVIAAPRAYYFETEKQPWFSSTLMVIEPSIAQATRLYNLFHQFSGIIHWWVDMDIINYAFTHEIIALPGDYTVINRHWSDNVFKNVFGDLDEYFNERVFVIHYSTPRKPWKYGSVEQMLGERGDAPPNAALANMYKWWYEYQTKTCK